MVVKLYPHQEKALGEIHNGSILKGGVGTGKSITAIAYFYTRVCGGVIRKPGENWVPFKQSVDLYIITSAKKRDSADWEREAAPFGISKERGSSFGNIQVTIDSWNNVINYTDVKDAFFIFDEQRLVGSGAWVKAFLKIAKANQWIMLSATPGDIWMDYCPLFIAHGFYKNRTEFLQTHVVYNNFSKYPKIERYIETGKLERYRRLITVEMPYARHTTRHERKMAVEYDREKFDRVFKERWHVYEDRPIREVSELFSVMRKVVNSDPSRLRELMKLSETYPRLIVFYNFNYELEMLRTLSTTLGIKVAEWNGHKHEEVPTGDRWLYLVQYTAGAEAWNCITTNATLFYSLNYSYKINEQAKGRTDRLNTPYTDIYIFTFRSNSMIDLAIGRSLAQKKSFNEIKFLKRGF